jgi:hypothetical protein
VSCAKLAGAPVSIYNTLIVLAVAEDRDSRLILRIIPVDMYGVKMAEKATKLAYLRAIEENIWIGRFIKTHSRNDLLAAAISVRDKRRLP